MSRSRRLVLSSPIAALLSFVVAGTALGLTWSPRTALSTGGGFPEGIARLNATSVVATYWQNDLSRRDIDVRRSTTSGTSWEAPKTLSTDGTNPR